MTRTSAEGPFTMGEAAAFEAGVLHADPAAKTSIIEGRKEPGEAGRKWYVKVQL
jgi:hypothetical protein